MCSFCTQDTVTSAHSSRLKYHLRSCECEILDIKHLFMFELLNHVGAHLQPNGSSTTSVMQTLRLSRPGSKT